MKYSLTIGWLYPDLMSIYGDKGNIIALQKRCEWRGIAVTIKKISLDAPSSEIRSSDVLVMGGAQDSQQTIVAKDLVKKKEALQEKIENGTPGLFVCGGFQFLGKYYKEADGGIIQQLGVLDMCTVNPGGKRLIGNISVDASTFFGRETMLVGFENHGGRTKIGKAMKPLGTVIKGYGSNAEDGQEGAVYKNCIGTYLHGPILPKNPILADWLIQKALEKKYKKTIPLVQLDDSLAQKARETVSEKML
ncbi:MAG TPA: type 1 glutamine amidotransferase [Patescibacteria group bacterium]|nr:type 1 glutamine amidotransferase [Patescibacteria group bacterium]